MGYLISKNASMRHVRQRLRLMLIVEDKREDDRKDQRVAREDKPNGLPVGDAVDGIMLDHPTAGHAAKERAEAVGHDHEESLGAGANLGAGFLLDKDRPGDIEEVESHAVDDHRQDQQVEAAGGVADAKERKARHPGEHTHDHDLLDAEALQEEGDGQDKERLGDLRNREQEVGVLHAKGVGVSGAEAVQKRAAKGVGNLQGGAQKHREDKEDRHALFFKEHEGVQAHRADPAGAFFGAQRFGWRQKKGIDAQKERRTRRQKELVGTLGPSQKVDGPHRQNKAHGAPDANRWEGLGDIEAGFFEQAIGNRVAQRDGRHKGHQIDEHQRIKERIIGDHGGADQRGCADQMTQPEHALRVDPAVGDDAGKPRHKQRGDAHGGVDRADLKSLEFQGDEHIAARRDQPRAPDKELEKMKDNKTVFDIHSDDFDRRGWKLNSVFGASAARAGLPSARL